MSRFVPVALVAALLIATGLAFVVTERLKLTPSPILRTEVTKIFSPVCECETDVATIGFHLRERDTVDLYIIDGSGRDRADARTEPAHGARAGRDLLERPRRSGSDRGGG